MTQQAPQRMNLEELVGNPDITPLNFWTEVERLNNDRVTALGKLAVQDPASGLAPKTRFSSNQKFLKNNFIVNNAHPSRLPTITDHEAKIVAHKAYWSLGVLEPEANTAEYVTALVPALVGSRRNSNNTENAAGFINELDPESIIKISRLIEGPSKRHTFNNVMAAMLQEAGIFLMIPGSGYESAGKSALESSKILSKLDVDRLHENPEAVTSMLRRQFDIEFYKLHLEARAGHKASDIENNFRRAQIRYINTYTDWIKSDQVLPGIAFEWLVTLAYRDYIMRHQLYASSYVRSAYPREDYPRHEMTGGIWDNKQSIDILVADRSGRHFLQCKTDGAGTESITDIGHIDGFSKTSGWYARPITIISAKEAISNDREANENIDTYLKRKFTEHAQMVKMRLTANNRFKLPTVDSVLSHYDTMFEKKLAA
ncbi:MAG TPA: hypothetical protein VGA08_02690 [Candidatus Saccharimonadales bacterium]